MIYLFCWNAFDQIICRLIDDVRILFFEKIILRDRQFDVVLGILRIFQAKMEASHVGTVGSNPGVTVAQVLLGWVIGHRGR